MVGRKTESGVCRVETLADGVDDPKYTEFPSSGLAPGAPKWANYIKGVVANFPGDLTFYSQQG
jgi:galactokinase